MTEQELLAVLDMSEDEQYDWLAKSKLLPQYAYRYKRTATLADLAFRLRDEAMPYYWAIGILTVNYWRNKVPIEDLMWIFEKAKKKDNINSFQGIYHAYRKFAGSHPAIDDIIAALIAKGREND